MKPFDYYRVTTVGQAVALLTKYQEKAAILAGGSDLLGLIKDGIEGPEMKTPKHLIDIKGIKDFAYIKEQKAGLRIGAGTTLLNHPLRSHQEQVPAGGTGGQAGRGSADQERCHPWRQSVPAAPLLVLPRQALLRLHSQGRRKLLRPGWRESVPCHHGNGDPVPWLTSRTWLRP